MSWDLLERGVRAGRTRGSGDALELVNSSLERMAEAVSVAASATPKIVFALLVGAIVWRRAGVLPGTAAALAIGVLGWTVLWPAVIDTLAVGVVGGALGALVAYPAVRLLRRSGRSVKHRRRRLSPGAVPGLTIAAALVIPVLAELLASDVTPAELAAVAIGVALLVPGPLARTPVAPRLSDWIAALVMTGLGGALVVGFVGGRGLGGALARALAAHDVIAIGQASMCLLLLLSLGALLSVSDGGDGAGAPTVDLHAPRSSGVSSDDAGATLVVAGRSDRS